MELKQLKYNEWQLLSDYIDHQLDDAKTRMVESRLKQDEVFHQAYQQLIWSKKLLAKAPRRNIPHQFTLTRQMAAEAQRGSKGLSKQRFPLAYGVVSGVASLIFVAILGIQLLPMLGNASMKTVMEAEAPAEEMLAMESAVEEEMADASADAMEESAPMLMQAAPAEESESALAEEAESGMAEEVVVEATPQPAEETNTGFGGGIDLPAETATPAIEAAAEAESFKEPQATSETELTVPPSSEEEPVSPLREAPTERAGVEETGDMGLKPSFPWRSVAVWGGLMTSGLVAIFSFVLGLYYRKRR